MKALPYIYEFSLDNSPIARLNVASPLGGNDLATIKIALGNFLNAAYDRITWIMEYVNIVD